MTPLEALAILHPDGVPPRLTGLIGHPDPVIRARYSAYYVARATGGPMPPPEGPSLLRRAANLVRAAGRFVRSGLATTPAEIAAERLAICAGCSPYYEGSTRTCLHADCGCYLPAKVTIASESCPIGAWAASARVKAKCGGCGKAQPSPG